MKEGFFRLANYIFGSNTLNEKMAMSTPVFQGRSRKMVMASPVLSEQKSDGWMMSFVLPSKYKLESLPRPLVKNIEILKIPSLVVATIRYNGINSESKINEKSCELISWLEDKEDLNIISEPRCAQFDSPYVLPFFRRNEIHITVQELEKKMRRSH